jgi:glycosyltransferase involved in cell wall biosynthesis
VTIVVPCRDRPQELDATLSGVTRQLRTGDTLLVVDSASRAPQAIADVARRHDVGVVRLDVPGASRARNAGWQLADTDIVVFVDDTVVVTDGWLDALVEPLAQDPRLGFVAGRIEPIGGGNRRAPVAVHSHPTARAVEPGDAAPGDSASLAVRASALREVGGFDERLGPGTWFAAADDLNLLDRILLTGWAGRYEPAARAGSPQPEGSREHVAKIWAYGKASGGRLALLARRDRRVTRLVAPQVLPGLRRRAGMAGDPADESRPPRSPLLATVRAAGTVTGFVVGLALLRRPAPPPTRAPASTSR